MRVSVPGPVRRALGRVAPASPQPPPPQVACRAPFTSMYLDQHGNVRACCMNDRHPMGNVTEAPLAEIWAGGPAQQLRRAMEEGDLGLGCEFCAVHVDRGRPDLAYSRWFDRFALDDAEPAWPRQLELSLSNTCNLRCVMCNGEWSSTIRSRVEHRAPLPTVYDDAFFEGLRPFLAHLDRVKFYGGEPFLASETLRVMELLVDAGLSTRCHATTNGTQWTPRVERILSMLPVDVAVSLDAATRETYESVRRGSSWETVRRNLDRFIEWSVRRDTWVSVTFCLMTVNWHELGDFCRLADELGVAATVNDVSQPAHLSLYRSSVSALESVVAGLEAQDDAVTASLGQNRAVWTDELVKLRRHLDEERQREQIEPSVVEVRAPGAPAPLREQVAFAGTADPTQTEVDALVERYLQGGAPRVDLDARGHVQWVEPAGVLAIAPTSLMGRHHSEIQLIVSETLGAVHDVVNHQFGHGVELSIVQLDGGDLLHVLATPVAPNRDRADGTSLHFSWGEPDGDGST